MADEPTTERVEEKNRGRGITRRQFLEGAAFALAPLAAAGAVVVGLNNFIPFVQEKVPALTPPERKFTQVDFMTWDKLTREKQTEIIDGIEKQHLSFLVNTPDLRLHVVHDDDKQMLVELNPDYGKNPLPQNDEKNHYLGAPAVYFTNEQYARLATMFPTENPYPRKPNNPVDIIIPEGTILGFQSKDDRVVFNPRRYGELWHPKTLAFEGLTPPPSK